MFQFVADCDKPIIGFLMLHGCRPSEARALKCKDVDLAAGTITISGTFSGRVYREKRKGRGARSVTIPIHPELEEYITGQGSRQFAGGLPIPQSQDGESLFTLCHPACSKWRKKKGGDRFGPSAL